ncbi:unnamed protein product [Ceratitis capitata]|uniref:(Mediterranean fruit fly) hypothetical protein n=1 Tax=Ceratitis capitata TaxID=7213 RepID=A0A811V776_CERCA|nr:unnamed protein product [Ceratitis capitata]
MAIRPQYIDELDAMVCKTDERNLLQFNMATINWREYFRSYLSGIRRYFFKDNDDSKLQKRRALYRRLQLLHQLLKSQHLSNFNLVPDKIVLQHF